MSVALLTLSVLPSSWTIKKVFTLVQYTGCVQVEKNLIDAWLDKGKNEWQGPIDGFQALAPPEANAIIGIQISTSAQTFPHGTFLYITYIGTPVVIDYGE